MDFLRFPSPHCFPAKGEQERKALFSETSISRFRVYFEGIFVECGLALLHLLPFAKDVHDTCDATMMA